jgi:ankyrin repeat protein
MLNVLEQLQQYWWNLTDEHGHDIPLTSVQQKNALGESPIHIAAWKGTPEDIEWLVTHGANINEPGEFGMSPLHYAYMSCKTENVRAVLAAGADTSLRCDRGLLADEGRAIDDS